MGMQEIEHSEALALAIYGKRDDIFVMSPIPVCRCNVEELRELIENGAVFASFTDDTEQEAEAEGNVPEQGTDTEAAATEQEAAPEPEQEAVTEEPDGKPEEPQAKKRGRSKKGVQIDARRLAELELAGNRLADIAEEFGVSTAQLYKWRHNHGDELTEAITALREAKALAERIFGEGGNE